MHQQTDRTPVPGLILQRKAAHVLKAMCNKIGLGSMAEHFDAENFAEWERPSDWEVMAMRRGQIIAYVAIRGEVADVVIPHWHGLIRPEHKSKFNPREYGLTVHPGKDPVTQDDIPDGRMENYAFGDVPGIDLPHLPRPKAPRHRAPRVVSKR